MGALFTKTEYLSKFNILDYLTGKFVSFIRDGKTITAQINQVTCHKYDATRCDLGQSCLSVIDTSGTLHKVTLTDETLKKVDIIITKQDALKYNIGSMVHNIISDVDTVVVKKGAIISKIINPNNYNTDNISNDSILQVKLDDNTTVLIPFSQPGLKLVVAGSQKYTLEEDSKYRVKYAKYKAKYLLQKK